MLYTVVDKDGKKFQFTVYKMVKTTNPDYQNMVGQFCYGGFTDGGSMTMTSIGIEEKSVTTSKILEIEDNGKTRTVHTKHSVYVLERV